MVAIVMGSKKRENRERERVSGKITPHQLTKLTSSKVEEIKNETANKGTREVKRKRNKIHLFGIKSGQIDFCYGREKRRERVSEGETMDGQQLMTLITQLPIA